MESFALSCLQADCLLGLRVKFTAASELYIVKFSLNANYVGVSAITQVQQIGSALSGPTGPNYTSGAMIRALQRKNSTEQVYMWTFNADNFTLSKKGDTIQTQCTDGASMAMTVSNMSGQCYDDLMTPGSPSKQINLSGSTLTEGSFDFAASLATATSGGVYLETANYHYKIFRQKYLSSNQSAQMFQDWWSCQNGEQSLLTLERYITDGTRLTINLDSTA